ncbi:MAG: patatin-like phospholipase family protein [Pseudomonadota bacterium]
MSTPQDILKSTPFGAGLSDATRRALVSRGRPLEIPGGSALFEAGSQPDAVYLILSGRLIVCREGASEHGGADEIIGYARAGEIVGEMSMLDGAPRTASAYALRDTSLLALDAGIVARLMAKRADFAAAVARTILRRSRAPAADGTRAPPRVFAVIASSRSLEPVYFADELAIEINSLGKKAALLKEHDIDCAQTGESAFHKAEEAVDALLLPCRIEDSDWYRFCLRHADRMLVFARRDSKPASPLPLSPAQSSPARRFRLVDLVMVHEGQGEGWTAAWARETEADRIFQWRGPKSRARLARTIAGRSLGLCLSGGGARAYAHFGVLKALRQRGAPIDIIGGASMGAIIGACVAMGWEEDEIEERLRDAFVESSPLSDHMLPVVSLTKGDLVEERLRRHFGDMRIENLRTPFFCVSSELTRGEVRVHRVGLLRHALRASISLPGVLPPVVDGADLLVDGAVLNNFPVDVMRTRHRGLTIGVDVAREASIEAEAFADPPSFVGWVKRYGLSSAPPIVSLLMRAATVGRPTSLGVEPPDILVAPDAPGVDLRDWREFDVAVAEGLSAARTAFGAAAWLLEPYCADATAARVAASEELVEV